MHQTVADTREPPGRDPGAEYRQRRDARRTERTRLGGWEGRVANGRLAVFAVVIWLAWLASDRGISPAWLLIPVGGFVGLVIVHLRLKRSVRRSERAVAFYDRGVERVEGRWAGQGEGGQRFADEDHPFADDLDLFGAGSMFERLNTARTAGGEGTLAAWLKRPPGEAEEIRARQKAVEDLAGRLDLREELDLLGDDVRVGLEPSRLIEWGGSGPLLPDRAIVRRVAVGLATLATIGLAIWVFGIAGPSPFFVLVLGELSFWLWLRGRAGQVLAPVDRRSGELQLLAELLRRLEQEEFKAPRLRGLRDGLAAEGETPSRQIERLARLVRRLDSARNPMIAPVAAMMLTGTRLAIAVEAWRRQSGPSIAKWLATVGEIEAFGSLGAYAFENPDDPYPEITAEGARFEAEGVGHPLIPIDRGIRNNVSLGREVRVLVVSGSNMSGKSTLLRTIGVNALLAMLGAPVRAKRLKLSPLTLGATLRVQDSLQAGKSRFYAELTRLREVVRLSGGEPPLLFLIDEIFHGTNSDDRRVGAEGVVRGLIAKGAIGLLTTHDLALATIADGLVPLAANVHFSDRFEAGMLVFDYTMKPGVVRHSNALALMRAVGLDV